MSGASGKPAVPRILSVLWTFEKGAFQPNSLVENRPICKGLNKRANYSKKVPMHPEQDTFKKNWCSGNGSF
jgi:hypothetical protein